jgi:hypothetical protein
MGRPRKEPELSEQQIWDMVEFSKAAGIYPQIFTPDLVNAALRNLNINQITPDEDKINTALSDVKNHEQDLISYGQDFEQKDMLYKRQLLYLGNLLSWDIDFICKNATEKDYISKAYQKDETILRDFLDKFDYKAEFTTVVRQLFRQESFFSIFRDEGEKYVLQEMPYKYCKTTGKFEYGLLYDLDMFYFTQAGVDIRCYPKTIAEKYKDIFGDGKQSNNYKPSAKLNHRDGTFSYWVQTSPEDNFWMFKLTPEIIAQVPFFAAQFPDLVLRPLMRTLQKNKYIQDASKILISLVALNKDNKTGNVRDMLSVSPETAGKFLSLMRQGISSSIGLAMGPWQDVKVVDFEQSGNKKNILDEYTKVSVGSGGNNTRLLYNSSDRSNILETTNSIAIDEALVTFLYPWFANFIEYQVNRRTKSFKFKIQFSGTNLPASMEKKLKDAKDLSEIGIVDLNAFAAAKGMNPFDLERKLQMNKAKKVNEMFQPLMNARQMSSKDGNRPQKSMNDLTDDGLETRNTGSNIAKGGDV